MKRFWAKVEQTDGCWFWRGYRNADGYGRFSVGGSPRRAHRVAWELERGAVPAGMHVLHSCDNPSCVRPDHLRIGTHAENMREMIDRRRRVQSEARNNGWKITPDQVREIRARYADGNTSHRKLAAEYGITATHIGGIIRRASWACVE